MAANPTVAFAQRLPREFMRNSLNCALTRYKMLVPPTLKTAERGNAEWKPAPSPIPHTVFDQPCINFVNSEFDDHVGSGRRYDRLILPRWRKWFLSRCGIPAHGSVSRAQLAELAALRRRLRRLLESGAAPTRSDIAEFNRILKAAPMTWELTLDSDIWPPLSSHLAPARGGWAAAMAIIVSSYADLVASGEVSRVKRCNNPHCCYLFFDSTRSATRRWCDPHACGNLVKVRLFRARSEASGRAGSSRRTDRSGRSRTRRTRG
jgi:predicted RNA-binding Zn ribbon-like protein